ncbi:hypothetical protein N866_15010 [Actinotalea ferrariae CF5-4]|uniref:AbiJ-NTD3 domain-containing protein n=1 Tax=Actinotalea ferrariae CF5-4 TaxID=948458 RepID=A0A021VLB0_9CELL|nr:hypothetical protein N866_15010 [Actinotalea ferrariae CF5-4]
MSDSVPPWPWWGASEPTPSQARLVVSTRTLSAAIEEALIGTFTRAALEVVLAEELRLTWNDSEHAPSSAESKRDVIRGYTAGWSVPELVALASRLAAEVAVAPHFLGPLRELISEYERGGGVVGPTKNLIFAANGPKPEIVLRDAVNNDIEIVANADYCLVYAEPVPPEGLSFARLIQWWREREAVPRDVSDREVGLRLHNRFLESLDSPPERVLFEVYAGRYKASFDIPALIPQVYLHYDPYDQRMRRALKGPAPLARQRMDFLLLFTDRRRVVIEVDGKQHYADGTTASPSRYAAMVSEDRRLRLAGYEVYRFGGNELNGTPASKAMVEDFFEQLTERMA